MKLRRMISAVLTLALCLALASCGQTGEAQNISFAEATGLEEIWKLDGKTVSIIGYMATLSPVSGKFMYLMNMPFQSCPFCVPNTTQLANTMAVYAPDGKTFAYTDQAVRITGTMKVEDYTDEYGYVYNYRIVNASCEEVDLSAVSAEYALWQSIASDGIVADINSMFDYVYFLCQWTDYTSSMTDDSGNTITFFLYPGDVENYLADDGIYGLATQYSDDYFPSLITRIRAISPDQLEDLAAIVTSCQTLAQSALAELRNGNYTYDESADKYTLNNSDDLYNQWYDQWVLFSRWLAKWQV